MPLAVVAAAAALSRWAVGRATGRALAMGRQSTATWFRDTDLARALQLLSSFGARWEGGERHRHGGCPPRPLSGTASALPERGLHRLCRPRRVVGGRAGAREGRTRRQPPGGRWGGREVWRNAWGPRAVAAGGAPRAHTPVLHRLRATPAHAHCAAVDCGAAAWGGVLLRRPPCPPPPSVAHAGGDGGYAQRRQGPWTALPGCDGRWRPRPAIALPPPTCCGCVGHPRRRV